MTDRRGLIGGLCLVIGGLPLLFWYGLNGAGYFGIGLIVIGLIVSYGATQVTTIE